MRREWLLPSNDFQATNVRYWPTVAGCDTTPTGVFQKAKGKLPAPQQKEPIMETIALASTTREPWNKGKLVGQKTPFKLKEIWALVLQQKTRRPVQFEITEPSWKVQCGISSLRSMMLLKWRNRPRCNRNRRSAAGVADRARSGHSRAEAEPNS
jgi:hypothetical protein